MKWTWSTVTIAIGLVAVSNLAHAGMDLSVGIGVPVEPVYTVPAYVSPPPPAIYPQWGDDDDYNDHDEDRHWRHEWREHRHEWREHHWRDRDDW